MHDFLKQNGLRKRKYRVAGPPRRKTYFFFFFLLALDFLEAEAGCNHVVYYIGLTHLFFYTSISQVFIGLSVRAFIFTNENDKKHTTNEGKTEDFEVLDKSIDYGVKQALNQILALPCISLLS